MLKWIFALGLAAFCVIYFLGYEFEIAGVKIGKKGENQATEMIRNKIETKVEIKSEPNPNADKCDVSTGFIFSQIKDSCVRPFEIGIELMPLKDGTATAFAIMDDGAQNVEVFFVESEPMLLKYYKIKQAYMGGKYLLTQTPNGFELYDNDELIFKQR